MKLAILSVFALKCDFEEEQRQNKLLNGSLDTSAPESSTGRKTKISLSLNLSEGNCLGADWFDYM